MRGTNWSFQRSSNQRWSLGSVLIGDVDVEFALTAETGEGEVAAAEVADDGGDPVRTVE